MWRAAQPFVPWEVTWWLSKDGYGGEHTFAWLGRLVQDQRLFSLSLAYVYRSRQGFYVSLSVPSGAQILGNGAFAVAIETWPSDRCWACRVFER